MNAHPEAARTPRISRVNPRQIRGAESPRRVLQVLLAFNERRPRATISELAEIVGVPLSTCYRYVGLLREVGLIEEGERSTYHVTPQIMHVARAAQVASKLRDVARPVLERVGAQVNETVMLMQQFGPSVVCVDSIAANRPIRMVFEPGHSMPIGVGASGKLLLSLLPFTEQSLLLARLDDLRPAFAERRSSLEAELPVFAGRGWATSDAEFELGIWAFAAVIRDGARATATISVAGPAFRLAAEKRQEIQEVVIAAATEITEARTRYL